MPYYRNDVSDQYQGTAFDPYTGRLNGAALVMNFLNQIESRKRKKKEEAWELEDRETQSRRGSLTEQNAGLDIAAKQREAANYQPPQSPAMKAFMERRQAKQEHKQRLDEIEARKKADIEVEKVKSGGRATTKPTLSFDTSYQYTKKIENFFPRITSERTRLESDLEKASKEYSDLSMLVKKNPKSFASAKYNSLKKTVDEGESRRSALSELEARLRAIWSGLQNGQPLSTEDANLIEKLLSTDLMKVKSGKSKAELEAEKSGVTLDPIK